MLFLLFLPTLASAQDFTATLLGDYGNVTVMEVNGNYDADNPDQTVNRDPRAVVSKEFFKTHKDEYDFLVIFTNFDFKMPYNGEAIAFYNGVKNDTAGIGRSFFDYTSFFGSDGKLQGVIDMGAITNLATDPLDQDFRSTLHTLSHELMHRWGAFVKLKSDDGTFNTALLGRHQSHWSFLFDSGSSTEYGNRWQVNGDGTFTSITPHQEMKLYGPLDLYLMGMIDRSEVPPMLLIENSDIDPAQLPQSGVSIPGIARTVTIDDIIAANGPRVPDAASSQKSFKTAFIYITRPNTFSSDDLYQIENIRNGFVTRHSVLTDGQSIVEVASTTKDELPANPGVAPPSTTPRAAPPNLDEAVQWLMADQRTDGSWMDLDQSVELDTAVALRALKNFSAAQLNYQAGLLWLGTVASGNVDYLARKIDAFAGAGQDIGPLVQDLLARRNADGGWGGDGSYESSAADTALVLNALNVASYGDAGVLSKAIEYLKSKQNADGGWGSEDKGGMVQETSKVLSAFARCQESSSSYQLGDPIARGTAWLIGRQNSDGGFGPSTGSGQAGPSTVYDTAMATMTLRELNASSSVTNNALTYLLGRQAENGSWNNSAYQTALAIETVFRATVDPDLSITSGDITIIPGTIKSLPSNIVINANISNLGQTGAQARVVFYEGSISEQNKLGEQTLSFPGQTSTSVTFSAVAQDGSELWFYIVVDPDNVVKESNELNNTAVKILSPEATYDFEVLNSDITISENPVDMFQDVTITSKITNKGTMTAYNAQVRYFIDEPSNPHLIATTTIDLPAGATVSNSAVWRTNKAGTDMSLAIEADPLNTFVEIFETNNKAVVLITVNGADAPNLTVSNSGITITPSPANERGNATISAMVRNEGFSTSNNIVVNFYNGVPGLSGVLLGSDTLPSIAPGQTAVSSFDWMNIQETGEKIIYVQVDPDNLILEGRIDDNEAYTNLNILTLPDLALSTNSITFVPVAPKEGDSLTLNVLVQNNGQQSANQVTVTASESGTKIGSQTVPEISGNSQLVVPLAYSGTISSGLHQILVTADPDNTIMEKREDNNSASKSIGIQNADLWISEPYISPNGDGIKDSTAFTFRLAGPQTTSVVVANQKEEAVRTFSGGDLVNNSGATIIWNGLDDSGMVVPDGQYQMRVVGANNALIGSLLVVVDNNRSSFNDAIGTKYFMESNLGTLMPHDRLHWLPDDSGFIFLLPEPNANYPDYTTGLYTMAPNGEGITRITPEAWTRGIDPVYDYVYRTNSSRCESWYQASPNPEQNNGYALSPDGQSVAFILEKYNKTTLKTESSQLWLGDRNGDNQQLLDSYDLLQGDAVFITDFFWSPNSMYLAYKTQNQTSGLFKIYIVKSDGTSKVEVTTEWAGGTGLHQKLYWSPDSNKLIYASNYQLMLVDLAGNKHNILSVRSRYVLVDWFNADRILVRDILSTQAYDIWIIDLLVQQPVRVAENVSIWGEDYFPEVCTKTDSNFKVWLYPINSKGYFVYLDDEGVNTYEGYIYKYVYKVCDSFGNCELALDIFFNAEITGWSPDGNKLIVNDYWYGYLYTYDITTKVRDIYTVGDMACYYELPSDLPSSYRIHKSDNLCLEYWIREFDLPSWQWVDNAGKVLADRSTSVWNGSAWEDRWVITSFDINTGEEEFLPLDASHMWPFRLSPLKNYIAYYYHDYQKPADDGWRLVGSTLNLTAYLNIIKTKSVIKLTGIAADANFEGYKIEYTDVNEPQTWNLIMPPSDVPQMNGTFTTWIPPYEGTFYVKLTVWDKAGNTTFSRRRVSWGLPPPRISNVSLSQEFFSPNGDGVKDTLGINYKIIAAGESRFDFFIYNESNELVRSYTKWYMASQEDSMTWDGHDSSGNIVPDGVYTVREGDYEFFVTVDNTPPDVAINMSGIQQDANDYTLYADLKGHAVDNNLRNWIVEYGAGDNPHEWNEFGKGESLLVGKNSNDNPILSSPPDVSINRFIMNNLAWLANKKFRITAEDYAGSRTTVISSIMEEKIFIHMHSWYDLIDSSNPFGGWQFETILLPPSETKYHVLQLAIPHYLSGFETIKTPIASLNVQYYSSDHKWIDSSTVVHSSSEAIELLWDHTGLGQQFTAIRVKAIDMFGREYYSNAILTPEIFTIDTCRERNELPGVFIALFEELKSLTFRSAGIDYKVYDSTKGDTVPTGIFHMPGINAELMLHDRVSIQMEGVGISGKRYHSNDAIILPNPCIDDSSSSSTSPSLKLALNPTEADCGSLSNGSVNLHAELDRVRWYISYKMTSYYIQTANGFQLLRQFDVSQKNLGSLTKDLGSLTIDTSTMTEGSYLVKVVLSYLDEIDHMVKEVSTSTTLIVERVLPTAKIGYPSSAASLCPVKITDPNGDWYVVSVQGKAIDSNYVRRYELSFGSGESPDSWMAAMTRTDGKLMPITGNHAVAGQLGKWDITDLKGGTYTLHLKVIDIAGNTSCTSATFSIDKLTEITGLVANKALFSPNGDGALDDVMISYWIDEFATLAVKAYKLVPLQDDTEVLDSVPVRTIISGLHHLSGPENTDWDGKDDTATTVPDGRYGIAVFATNSCGNIAQKWVPVDVDNTPPATIISYPTTSAPLGNIIEVKGTADDRHFQNYSLVAGQGDSPSEWVPISSLMKSPVINNILGKWNTFGLDGVWTLKLTATDTVGNKNTTSVTIDLGLKKALIKELDAVPKLFSPNNDGKLDTALIQYELTDACLVNIEILDSAGVVRRTYSTSAPSSGNYTYTWDGRDSAGIVVSDGACTVKLNATLSSNSSVTQDETITVIVDSTLPTVDIKQPLNNACLAKTDVAVSGTISDLNLTTYSITNTGETGLTDVDQANQSRENYTFGIFNDIAEGSYTLHVSSRDLGENENNKNIVFTIDRTPPVVKLDTPNNGEYYGTVASVVSGTVVISQPTATMKITGSIAEKNLEVFNLRYGLGDTPTQWTELVTGNSITSLPQSFAWSIGQSAGIPDGLYSVSLFAKDRAGAQAEVKVKVTIDNTPPTVAITSPLEGGYVRSAVEVKGTAFDQNLDKYAVDISEGVCDIAFKWAPIKKATVSIQDGILAAWQALPADGEYCIRVIAQDKVSSSSEAKINVKVDTHPPVAPVLTGKVDNKTSAQLNWTGNTETDLAGYNIYRGGQKVNDELLAGNELRDDNLGEGVYLYSVKAVDFAGWESPSSNEVKLTIDVTGPEARISVPSSNAVVSDLIDIKGTAYSKSDFKEYRLFVGQGISPAEWDLIRTSPVPMSYGTLAQWDTFGLSEAAYSIKLETEDISGNISSHQVTVTIDNTPPEAPLLLSVVPIGSAASAVWKLNTESDVAGYLLYRNDQLANASSIVAGDVKPYLLSGPTYTTSTLPDGAFTFAVAAMDKAGNMSDLSNTLSVSIDTHAPKATITDPVNNAKFEHPMFLRAESDDLDIASIQFQYKRTQDAIWTDLGGAVTTQPFGVTLDPVLLGLAYGDYNLRAVATDTGAGGQPKTDASPAQIKVTFADMTAPAAPTGVSALVSGASVTLTWVANTDGDLVGYNVYKAGQKITASLVSGCELRDQNLADETYSYTITAVDTSNNESKPSNTVTARVYSPVLAPLTAVTGTSTIKITGSNTEANASVDLFVDNSAGNNLQTTVSADTAGNFAGNIELSFGNNIITARARDDAGNVSRMSIAATVIYNEPPSAPSGLTADVQGDMVNLAWEPNSETDLMGYYVYRNNVRVNSPIEVAPGEVYTSSTYSYPQYNWYFTGDNAFDGVLSSYWQPETPVELTSPQWLEMEFSDAHWIRSVTIQWYPLEYYAASDYAIQSWNGADWETVATVIGNVELVNDVEIRPLTLTTKLRIYITAPSIPAQAGSKAIMLSEVTIYQDRAVTGTSFIDMPPSRLEQHYSLTAVDVYGLESLPSSTVSVTVGDVTLPSAPIDLMATVIDSAIVLEWSPNTEPDIADYTVYRLNGPVWDKVGNDLITEMSFTDANLPNNTYHYRVTASDTVGNESEPSNEATATIAVATLAAPTGLASVVLPEGSALQLSWNPVSGGPAGYHLYRSTVAGGPYDRVNSALLSTTSYLNSGLTNGTTYYYVVTAVDAIGNEGAYSNEASGTPANSIVPTKPVILHPTVTGSPITVYGATTDISGTADPGASVELTGNGVLIGQTIAEVVNNSVTSFPIDCDGYSAAISPDGKSLAYSNNSSIGIMSLSTGSITQVFQLDSSVFQVGWNFMSWSPDGAMIVFPYWDSGRINHVGILDVLTSTSSPLIDDMNIPVSSPSWSPDGGKIVFVKQSDTGSRDIWIKDLASGAASQIVSASYANAPRISPDGRTLAYFDSASLYLYDFAGSTSALVDDSTDGYELHWSPDGTKIAFVSYKENEYGDVFILDMASGNRAPVPGPGGSNYYPYYLTWTADSKYILFDIWDYTNQVDTIWIADVQHFTPAVRIMPDVKWDYFLGASATGQIVVINYDEQDTYSVRLMERPGGFSFNNVSLSLGENIFTVTAKNDSGLAGPASDAISVTLDTSNMPDLSVTEDDIYLYPPYPIAGEQMAINAEVWNSGPVDVSNMDVDVYIWNALGQLELLASERMASIPAGESALITATWDSMGKTGGNRIVLVVDPDDAISESEESNNMAVHDFFVADTVGLDMTTATDAAQYGGNQEVTAGVLIRNTGPALNVVLDARIEDEKGYPVSSFERRSMTLAYATTSAQSYTWNTGSTFTGQYQVHAILADANGTALAENTTPFSIVSDAAVDLVVVTDKFSYAPGENVATNITIKNSGSNSIISSAQATVSISNADGAVLFSEAKTAKNLMPGASVGLSSTWNTGPAGPGDYRTTVVVSFDGGTAVTRSAAFKVSAMQLLIGSITASPSVVASGNTTQLLYSVVNSGNVDATGLLARITILDPETQTIMQASEEVMDLPANTNKSSQAAVNTSGYGLKTYTVVLQTQIQGVTKNIANTSFTVKDLAPPIVTITSPISNGTYSSTVTISAFVADNASGVDRVEYQVDGNAWKLIPVADPSKGRYATTWAPAPVDNGGHIITIRATDRAGNTSSLIPVNVTINIQVDTVPPLAVIVGAPASPTNERNALLTIAGDDVIAYQYNFDFGVYSAETSTLAPIVLSGLVDGNHTVLVVGRDSAGNWQKQENATQASWVVDLTPPTLLVSTLPDGGFTNNPLINVAGAASDANGIQSVVVSGQTVTISTSDDVNFTFSGPLTLATGSNNVTTAATDNAGNTTMDARTIILDLTAPVVTITNPADNSLTNTADLDVTGFVDQPTTVSIKVNGASPLPDVVTGSTFTFPITLVYDLNHIDVTAVDPANNTGSAKRTIMLDNLNPALAITSPNQDMGTDQTGIVLSGTVSDLTELSLLVTCPTASLGIVTQPTATTWSVELTDMQQGNNTVTVQAVDEAGNSTSVVRNIIHSATPITIDPVMTPTNISQQQISGTMVPASTVIATCSTAFMGEVSYPTPTTWQVIIAGMTEGENTISVTAIDLEGHVSEPVYAAVLLDTRAPETTPSPAAGEYYNSVTASLAVDEPATIYYTTDGSAPTPSSGVYAGPLFLTETTTLNFFAVDPAMNPEEVKGVTYTVIHDATSPVTTLSVGSPNYISGISKLSVTSATGFTLSASDDISGVATIAYRLEAGAGNTYVTPFSLVTEGSHTIGYWSTDNAANVEQEKYLGVVVDNTPPASTISLGGPPVTASTLISITSIDAVSGVRLTEYAVDSGAWTTYNGAFTLEGYSPGTHIINYRSNDNVGNIESTRVETVTLIELCSDALTRCNDSNACTTDMCEPLTGACGHSPAPDGTICNDNNPATINDSCLNGTCAGTLDQYAFFGFFSPVDNPPYLNTANAGQAVPIKWRLIDANGVPVSDPASFKGLSSYAAICGSFSGDPADAIEEYAPGSSGLLYQGDGNWQFNWKTPKTYARQCRVMVLTLGDNSTHTAQFKFK